MTASIKSMAPGENNLGLANLGFGVGLRSVHFEHILRNKPEVDWFEAITENFIDSKGRPRYILDQIAERYSLVLHGVSMSIGSTDPLNMAYLKKLASLADATGARWVSDHICWTGTQFHNVHDLLPLPLNEETLAHVIDRVNRVQDILQRPLILENPSSYLSFTDDSLAEWEFIGQLAKETNCGLLLDVNNVYVSSVNHGFDAQQYIRSLPHDHIVQCHLAGHSDCGTHLIDTHDGPVCGPVWKLFQLAWELTGGISTLMEWDASIPPFEEMHAEVLKAQQLTLGRDEYLLEKEELQPSVDPLSKVFHPLHPLILNNP